MANTYAYILDGKAYINLTNKCHNACEFCIRNTGDGVKDAVLWLDREPASADEVIAAFDKLSPDSDEVVFCGFGEPTEKIEILKACARELKKRGFRTRLNTNGLGNLANGRDITGELEDIDIVSVSLNSCTAQKYAEITHCAYGEDGFKAVLDFAAKCKSNGKNVVFTVVDTIPPEDIAACRSLAAGMGIPLRVREYVPDNYNNG